MVVKHIQIYGVHVSPDKSFFVSYHHPLGRDKLLIPRSSGGGLIKPISKCIALSQL